MGKEMGLEIGMEMIWLSSQYNRNDKQVKQHYSMHLDDPLYQM